MLHITSEPTRRQGWLVAALLAAALLASSRPAAAQGGLCAPPDRTVYVGGVTSMSSLADPAASRLLRATGRVGLYMHGSGVPPAYYGGTLAAVYRAFAETGNGVGEVGYSQLQNAVYMNGAFHAFYDHGGDPLGAPGQVPWAMIDNPIDNFLPARLANGTVRPAGTQQSVAGWRAELAAAHAHGIRLVVPVISPNDDVGLDSDPATGADWTLARAVAAEMGSVAIDAPPHYFLTGNVAVPGTPASYRAWLVGFVRWAAARGLRIFWIVSPNVSGPAFLRETQDMVALLGRADALPHYWVVENYAYPNAVTGVTKQSGGAGYTRAEARVSAPSLAWGTQAVVEARVRGGEVAEIAVRDSGSGYLGATVTVTGDGTGARFAPVVSGDDLHAAGQPAGANPNVVGTETMPQSVAGVALWVARNAPTRRLPPGAVPLAGARPVPCATLSQQPAPAR